MDKLNLVSRLLEVLENEIIPLTSQGVTNGNKIFGAAIIRKSDLSLVTAGTNLETKNPLYHGEISCINNFWQIPAEVRPKPKDCLFISTHEPCSMCLSAITWSGFDNFYYFFSYEDSRDKFQIPHDLNILKEVFKVEDGQYQSTNFYFRSYDIQILIKELTDEVQIDNLNKRVIKIKEEYAKLSETYQKQKDKQQIPLG